MCEYQEHTVVVGIFQWLFLKIKLLHKYVVLAGQKKCNTFLLYIVAYVKNKIKKQCYAKRVDFPKFYFLNKTDLWPTGEAMQLALLGHVTDSNMTIVFIHNIHIQTVESIFF